MSFNAIILDRPTPHIAVIRLNRPEKHNAINAEMARELIECLDALEADADVRVIVLTGAGEKAFCAGADMGESVQAMAAGGRRDAAAQAAVRLARVRKPVIAAVNGYAYGGGAVFAASCDIRVCADTARFRFLGASYGLVVGASLLPRLVGAPLAKELVFTARTVDAAEALRIGLANRVVPLAGLEAAAHEIAAAIAENDPAAVAASKEVIDTAMPNLEAAKLELAHNLELRQSAEHRARFRAATDRVVKRGQ
ncbi:MAG: enoyl-CoA hydratase/isomerase family protein [Dehalococcoidia bacterium]|nr:enoyl-CoA hydratase/isomerase family protein [Dehalococcoidia bacterium]